MGEQQGASVVGVGSDAGDVSGGGVGSSRPRRVPGCGVVFVRDGILY